MLCTYYISIYYQLYSIYLKFISQSEKYLCHQSIQRESDVAAKDLNDDPNQAFINQYYKRYCTCVSSYHKFESSQLLTVIQIWNDHNSPHCDSDDHILLVWMKTRFQPILYLKIKNEEANDKLIMISISFLGTKAEALIIKWNWTERLITELHEKKASWKAFCFGT